MSNESDYGESPFWIVIMTGSEVRRSNMEQEFKEIISNLCLHLELGEVLEEPIEVKGGLLHTMFKVTTDQGYYAIKCLNPNIMSRASALNNTIYSEKISEILASSIPVIAARKINSKQVHQYKDHYYIIYDWFDGKSIYPPEIREDHCKLIGDILGRIHSLGITVHGLKAEAEDITIHEWNEYLIIARRNKASWLSMYEEAIDEIIAWNQKVLNAKTYLSNDKVISHRDLDPKNVMWQENHPYIIDWEAAGYINPYQELLEVLNYWTDDANGSLHKSYVLTILTSYKAHKSIGQVNWDAVLDSGYEGMLGWLAYSVKRALGIEGSSEAEVSLGEQQILSTITELKRYDKKRLLLKEWLLSFTSSNY